MARGRESTPAHVLQVLSIVASLFVGATTAGAVPVSDPPAQNDLAALRTTPAYGGAMGQTLAASSAESATAQALPFHDGMEVGENGWTSEGLWHQTSDRANGSLRSWYYGEEHGPGTDDNSYDTGVPNQGTLSSPEIDLAGAPRARLSFWSHWEAEAGEFEHPMVEIIDGGGRAQLVAQALDRDGSRVETVDLTPYVGQVIQVRFVWDTKDAFDNDYEGWYVDDFEVVALPALAPSLGGLVNGNFESGDLAGWSLVEEGAGAWFAQSGNASPLTTRAIASPPEGAYAATTDQSGPGTNLLLQELVVPSDGNHVLSFWFYYANEATAFHSAPTLRASEAPRNQQFRVDLLAPGSDPFTLDAADILRPLLVTSPQDPLALPPREVAFDLAELAGAAVVLRFAEVDNVDWFHASIDDVRFGPGPAPPRGQPCGSQDDAATGGDIDAQTPLVLSAGDHVGCVGYLPDIQGGYDHADRVVVQVPAAHAFRIEFLDGDEGACALAQAPGPLACNGAAWTGWREEADSFEIVFSPGATVGTAYGWRLKVEVVEALVPDLAVSVDEDRLAWAGDAREVPRAAGERIETEVMVTNHGSGPARLTSIELLATPLNCAAGAGPDANGARRANQTLCWPKWALANVDAIIEAGETRIVTLSLDSTFARGSVSLQATLASVEVFPSRSDPNALNDQASWSTSFGAAGPGVVVSSGTCTVAPLTKGPACPAQVGPWNDPNVQFVLDPIPLLPGAGFVCSNWGAFPIARAPVDAPLLCAAAPTETPVCMVGLGEEDIRVPVLGEEDLGVSDVGEEDVRVDDLGEENHCTPSVSPHALFFGGKRPYDYARDQLAGSPADRSV